MFKRILICASLFLNVLVQAQAQYIPSDGTAVNKPIGDSGFPLSMRNAYLDKIKFTFRPFVSTAEVLSYLNTSAKREWAYSVIINTGGTISNVTGKIVGGTNAEWWFRDGVADENLVLKIPTNNLMPQNSLYAFSNGWVAIGNSITYGYSQTALGGRLKPWPNFLSDHIIPKNTVFGNLGENSVGIRKAYYNLVASVGVNPNNPLVEGATSFNDVRGFAPADTAGAMGIARAGIRAVAAVQFTKNIQFYVQSSTGVVNPNVTTSQACSGCTISNIDTLAEYGSRAVYFRNQTVNTQTSPWHKFSVMANETITIANVVGTSIAIGTLADSIGMSRIKVTVDGVDKVTYNPNGRTNLIKPEIGRNRRGIVNDAIIVRGLSEGSHTVKLTFLDGGKEVYWDYVAGLVDPDKSYALYVMDIFHMNATGYANPTTTQVILDACTAAKRETLNTTYSGFNIVYVPVNATGYYNANDPSQIQSDGIHPTELGEQLIAKAVYDAAGYGLPYLVNSTNLQGVTDNGSVTTNSIKTSGYAMEKSNYPLSSYHASAGSVGYKHGDYYYEASGTNTGNNLHFRFTDDVGNLAADWLTVTRNSSNSYLSSKILAATDLFQVPGLTRSGGIKSDSYIEGGSVNIIENNPQLKLVNLSAPAEKKKYGIYINPTNGHFSIGKLRDVDEYRFIAFELSPKDSINKINTFSDTTQMAATKDIIIDAPRLDLRGSTSVKMTLLPSGSGKMVVQDQTTRILKTVNYPYFDANNNAVGLRSITTAQDHKIELSDNNTNWFWIHTDATGARISTAATVVFSGGNATVTQTAGGAAL